MDVLEISQDLFDSKEGSRAILYMDHTKEDDLFEFISKAQQQGLNCLDLSKRNITDFPAQLLELTSLQYLYLEGNKLTELPPDIFLRLPHLKWLDLRNNQLTSIPSFGLVKHRSLQHLLLGQNRLQTLPFELGKVKTLSALNLDGNPLDYPPFRIIKKGVKAIQHYLRDRLTSDSDSSSNDDQQQEQTPRFPSQAIPPRKSKSEVGYYETIQSNLLPPHLQPCIQFKRMNCSTTRPPSTVRIRSQSDMKYTHIKPKTEMKGNNNPDTDLYVIRQQSLMHLKHRDITIDDEIQQLRQQSFITSKVEYEEPIIHTPFLMDPHFVPMLNTEQQNTKKYERHGNHPIEDEEERRKHDRHIQDRIRQITDRMLRRRLEARSSLFEEKRQVRLELREIRRLEFDAVKQHRFKSNKKS